MAQFSIRTFTWADLASSSVTWNDWTEWSGNGTTIGGSTGFGNLVVTSDEIDLGADKNFVVTASVLSNGTNSVVIQVKPDGGAFANKTVSDTLTGRFVKFQVTVVNGSATARLDSFEGDVIEDTISESFNQLSVASGGTTLPITRNYNRVLNITSTTSDSKQVVTTASGTAPAVKGVDLDTWGKVDANITADITVIGLPAMATDSAGNIVLNP
tara:strand:- start:239 stop:877 length:639 start_codon:yes stop_codon:yes gene_type:complete